MKGHFLAGHEAFHAVDEYLALEFEGDWYLIVGEEEVIGADVNQEKALWLALGVGVLV